MPGSPTQVEKKGKYRHMPAKPPSSSASITSEFRPLTETVALQARARAAQALGHAQRRRQFLERAQDHVAIGFGGDAKAQVWRGRCGHGVLDGVAAKDRP